MLSPRDKLILASILLAAIVLGWIVEHWSVAALAFFIGVLGWLASSELRLRTRLGRLTQDAMQLIGQHEAAPHTGSLAALRMLPAQLEARLAREETLLRQEAQRRAHAEESLRHSKERYALAVTGANDGIWEWNYKTKRAYFSPRAKSMLGYTENEIGDSIREWRARIHPEDLGHALVDLQAHLDGRTTRFEREHRMMHKDGTWRWVLARAAAVRHASGAPERLIGLYTDITARRQMQQLLIELADGLAGLRGEEAYNVLVRQFATITGTRAAFLTECIDTPATRVRMLAYWCDGRAMPCIEYSLSGTPCADVISSGEALTVTDGVRHRWPREKESGTEAYIGLPCIDTTGSVIGHIACTNDTRIVRDLPRDAVLKLFAVRASVEMERQLLERGRNVPVATAQTTLP